MVIMPYSHDQPDNARRMRRMNLSRTIERKAYKPARVARTLRAMLDNPGYAAQAARVAAELNHEDGVCSACDAIEELCARSK